MIITTYYIHSQRTMNNKQEGGIYNNHKHGSTIIYANHLPVLNYQTFEDDATTMLVCYDDDDDDDDD